MPPPRPQRRIGPPAERFGAFRLSLLSRIDPADLAQDHPVYGPLARQIAASPPPAQAEQLVDLIESELSTINARVEDTWRERVAGEIGAQVDLDLLVDQLNLEAYIAPPGGNEPPVATLHLGAVLALDDLVLFALSSGDILVPDRPALAIGDPDTPFSPPEALSLSGAGLDREGRFFDYRGVLDHGVDRPRLTHAMAINPWRLLQASLLSELALAWVLFHERAHWALGHLDLIDDVGGAGMALAETGQTAVETLALHADGTAEAVLPVGSHRMLEGQADTQAFFLLCVYAMRMGGARDRYQAASDDFGVPDDPRVLRTLSFGQTLRLCITAIALVCVAFDETLGGKGLPAKETHPRPATRLMSMLINSPIVSPIARREEDGPWILAAEDRTGEDGEDNDAFRELTQAGIGMALLDILIITQAVGADFIPLEPDDRRPTGLGPSDWLADLTRFWIADGAEREPCVSPAGRELAALLPIEAELRPRLEALQERRFGAVLSLDLGDIWPDRPS